MTNVVTFNNHNIELINQNNRLYMTCRQIAEALDMSSKNGATDLYNAHKSEFDDEMSMLIKHGRTRVRVFNREGAWLIGMFARTPKAAEFRKWVLKVLGEVVDCHASLAMTDEAKIKSLVEDGVHSYMVNHLMTENTLPAFRNMVKSWMRDACLPKAQNQELVQWCANVLGLVVENRVRTLCENRFEAVNKGLNELLSKELTYEKAKLKVFLKDEIKKAFEENADARQ